MTYFLFADARNNFTNKSYKYLPLLMPMTKAAKRGLDIVQDFLQTNDIPTPKKFVVSGQSKRGWITFLLAAIDTRVVAAVPIVFDIIRFNAVINNNLLFNLTV
jgi:PhoPQ-activated pathogenicity-related protein